MAERQLAVVTDEPRNEWDATRREFIRKNFCGGAPDAMAAIFLELCERRRLSPEARHVYLVNRAGKNAPANWVIQTGIDGYRLIADRTGRYAGSDDPIFEYNPDRTQIVRATVTVRKIVSGQVCAFTASARMDEYAAGGPMWAKMPHTMIGKCAEALALRKAFPEELSGMYTDAEMDQAETPHSVDSGASRGPDAPAMMVTPNQIKYIHVLKTQKGLTDAGIKALHGKPSAKSLTAAEASALIAELGNMPDIVIDEPDEDGGAEAAVMHEDWGNRNPDRFLN